MLKVKMTPTQADRYCESLSRVPRRSGYPCPNMAMGATFDCKSPECVMCCEAHKQGRK